jgi:hypothetical protein
MLFGRSTNLWLGLVAAAVGFVQVTVITLRPDLDPVGVATVLGALSLLLGAVITLIANQPPTIKPGDTVMVQTPPGEPNESVVVH